MNSADDCLFVWRKEWGDACDSTTEFCTLWARCKATLLTNGRQCAHLQGPSVPLIRSYFLYHRIHVLAFSKRTKT